MLEKNRKKIQWFLGFKKTACGENPAGLFQRGWGSGISDNFGKESNEDTTRRSTPQPVPERLAEDKLVFGHKYLCVAVSTAELSNLSASEKKHKDLSAEQIG